MLFYLSSYRLGNAFDQIRKRLPTDSKIACIPNAMDSFSTKNRNHVVNRSLNEWKEKGYRLIETDLRKFFNARDEVKEFYDQFDAFYITGGNVFVLRKAFELSGFDKYLEELIKSDSNKIYTAYSAGICVLSKNLTGYKFVDVPDISCYGYPQSDIIWQGLNLLEAHPIPHFQSNHAESEQMNKVKDWYESNNYSTLPLKDGENQFLSL